MLFKKKTPQAQLDFQVYLDELHKFKGFAKKLGEAKNANDLVILTFFEDTRTKVEEALRDEFLAYATSPEHGKLSLAFPYELASVSSSATLVFADMHPLPHQSQKIAQEVMGRQKMVRCFISLEDPIMKAFGSDRIQVLMEKMGMKPDEVIQHPMVDKSIFRAMESIGKKVSHPKEVTSSCGEWLKINGI